MNQKTIVGISIATIALGGLGLYGIRKANQISNDLDYNIDPSTVVIRKVGINQVSFTVDLLIENTGNLDLQARDLRLKVLSGRNELTIINKYGDFSVKPNETTKANVEVSFSPSELIAKSKGSGVNIGNWKQVPITFAGSLKVKQLGIFLPIPFRVTYKLSEFL